MADYDCHHQRGDRATPPHRTLDWRWRMPGRRVGAGGWLATDPLLVDRNGWSGIPRRGDLAVEALRNWVWFHAKLGLEDLGRRSIVRQRRGAIDDRTRRQYQGSSKAVRVSSCQCDSKHVRRQFVGHQRHSSH